MWLNQARSGAGQAAVSVRIGGIALTFGAVWLLAVPLVIWLIATLYIPVMGPSLRGITLWLTTGLSTALIIVSVLIHVLSHAVVARLTDSALPPTIRVDPLGDASQQWPVGPAAWREALAALSGPLASLVLAGLAYLVWDRQPHPVLNATLLLIMILNLGLALINLAPGFPLDGGRLARAILWRLLMRPTAATRLSLWSGRLLLIALLAWGIRLLLEQVQFSGEAGAGTIVVVVAITLMSWRGVAWPSETPDSVPRRPVLSRFVRAVAVGVTLLLLLAPAASVAPTLYGMRAPGSAVTVEQMISLPADYRHDPEGHFLLTTIVSQTPIVAGQLAYAYSSPAIELVPPERVVPRGISPQDLVRQQYRLLTDSTLVAKIVALRLAGYDVQIAGREADVREVFGEGSDHHLETPGDRIVAINRESTITTNDLNTFLHRQPAGTNVDLLVERNGERVRLQLPLKESAGSGDLPHLELTARTNGERVELPFPVQITPQQIVGGPSAGLMFTLTVYNLLTPADLTSGYRIAGTGTINLDGEVGPIGGVAQKVAAAEDAGARYFLVPTANAATARGVADGIQVVEVANVEEALDFLRNLPQSGSS